MQRWRPTSRSTSAVRRLARAAGCAAAAILVGFALPAAAQTDTTQADTAGIDDAPKGPTIFDGDSILHITVSGAIRDVTRDRDTVDAQYHPVKVSYTDGARQVTIPARARTRGIWRRNIRNCHFPPLRLRFEKEDRQGTMFRGQKVVKLVTHCQSGDRFEEYVTQEYLLYRVHNLITPHSLRARLARVTYDDPGRGKTETYIGILLEDDDELADRVGGEIVEAKGGTFGDFDPTETAVASLFQYMIGNTDWSLSGLHNMAIIMRPNAMPIPLPYDFDFAGAVGTHYATPDPRIGIRSVRERRYRGICRREAEWAPIVERFNAQRDAIRALYQSAPILDPKTKEQTLEYFDEFYKTINDKGRLKRDVIERCLPGA